MPLYSEFRGEIRNGDLLAWQGNGFVSRVIRGWTGETYSHVGIAFKIHGRVVVAEAREFKGVSLSALSNRLPVYHVPTEIKWTPALSKFVMDSWDKPYSYLDAVRAGLGMPTREDNGWQCAEYAAAVLVKAGRLEASDSFAKTPGQIVKRLLSTGGTLHRLKGE